MLYIFIALIGASIGSFINVVSVRLNNGEIFILQDLIVQVVDIFFTFGI